MAVGPVIWGGCCTFTTTLKDAVAVQPSASVAVTPNVPVWFTSMLSVVCPPDHRYEVRPVEAVSVEVSPWQMLLSPVMPTLGGVGKLTVAVAVPVQPEASETVTK